MRIFLLNSGPREYQQPKYRSLNFFWATLSALVILLSACSTNKQQKNNQPNPFTQYLSDVDPNYEYHTEQTKETPNYTTYTLKMTSQTWLRAEQTQDTLWWHWLTIVVPREVKYQTALLWIGGGSARDSLPPEPQPLAIKAAMETNSVTAYLHNVPYQPITFNEQGETPRIEDAIIAYGWDKFLRSGADDDSAEWLSRLPMTAAAQRAMDTVTEVVESNTPNTVDTFMTAGASKRGWTTWTTAIFDDRVVAIAPAVIDLLNIKPSFRHHWRAYGEWSPAVDDYVEEDIMKWQYSQEFNRLLELVDPYSYLDSLKIPKYIINAANDEFFLPDSWQFYWDDLPGNKALRYIPNTGHDISGTDALENLISFYELILRGEPIPDFTWKVTGKSFVLRMNKEALPDSLRLWKAKNSNARDFRLYVVDKNWSSSHLSLPEDGQTTIELQKPADGTGYEAWFVEAIYTTSTGRQFKQTTGVKVLPDRYPYEPYNPKDSLGTIVRKS